MAIHISTAPNGAEASHAVTVPAAHDIEVRALTSSDLMDALRLGFDDFKAKPSHMFVLGLLYPFAAAIAAGAALDHNFVPLLFPIATGFALTGPFAAIVLYEISYRRERGQNFTWLEIGAVFKAASSWAVIILGLAAFGLWLVTAQAIFNAAMGGVSTSTLFEFLEYVLTTPQGWALIIFGNAAGFVFAAIVLASNVVSFPMLLDRNVGAPAAVATSLRVTAASPFTIALWGLIIAGSMLIGFVTVIGMAVILPVIGHASWHVYRKAVARAS
ncbi:MAG: DUF2189 domain-containing protein [Alphaproteobacteria bacterium]|nr:DUF2189 domain-containing protein [Alphaproteobacteria bacterium]